MERTKAELVIHEKLTSPKGLIRELSVWRLKVSERYPEGLKYRLVLADSTASQVHLLYDNHWPKGHHVHRGDQEEPYLFKSMIETIREFREQADIIERRLS